MEDITYIGMVVGFFVVAGLFALFCSRV